MNPRNELGLPPIPPLPPDVRERALHPLLDEIDATDPPAPSGHRRHVWAPLLTAAAAVLVAIAVAAAVALSPARPDGPPQPAAVPTAMTTPDPVPQDDRAAPTGDPATDTALTRCATAVAGSGRAAEYPPTGDWTSGPLQERLTPLEHYLIVDDSFVCLLTPTSVVVTSTAGIPVGGVRVVGLTAADLVLVDPGGRRFTIGPAQQRRPDDGGAVMVYRLDPGVSVGDLRLTVSGPDGYDGPVPTPVPPLTVVDQPLPTRAADAPGGPELADCLARFVPEDSVYPDLWIPVGRHDVGGTAPSALLARIGDLAAGFCIDDPAAGPSLVFGALPAPGVRPQVVTRYRGAASAVLLTAPPGTTRVQIAPEDGSTGPTACTVLDGLAMCTLDDPLSSGEAGQRVVVTASTATDPQPFEVYQG
jgi:hypothetical protein